MVESKDKLKEAYQMCLVNNPYAEIVVMDILNDCGFFATDKDCIKPEMLAFAHQLLMKMGVYDTSTGLSRYVNQIIDSAKNIKGEV